jgi:hypothetical protein
MITISQDAKKISQIDQILQTILTLGDHQTLMGSRESIIMMTLSTRLKLDMKIHTELIAIDLLLEKEKIPFHTETALTKNLIICNKEKYI